MIYPNSNLPTVSQSWGRAIQKGIESLEATIKTNEINNKARDVQLQANYVQTNKNIQDIKFALTSSGIAVTGVNEIKNAIYVPGTTKIDGSSIQTGTLSASTITTGTLNAATVNLENINASKITAGALTGITVQTGTTGQRVILGGSQINFYDSSNNLGATMSASSSALGISNGGNTLNVNNVGSHITGGSTGVYCGDYGSGTSILKLVAPSTEATGTFYSSGVITAGSNLLANSGFVQSSTTYSNNVQSGRIMYVASNGTFNCATSSARYKQDINPYVVDVNKFFQLEPVSFRYKMAVEQFGEDADIAHGFIAEQAAEVGMHEFVDFQDDGNGGQRPDNFRYIDFTAAMYSVIKTQQETIESLTARIEALESKV